MIINLSARRDQLSDERTLINSTKNVSVIGQPVLVPESLNPTNNWRVYWPVVYNDLITGEVFPQWVFRAEDGFLVRMETLPTAEEMAG